MTCNNTSVAVAELYFVVDVNYTEQLISQDSTDFAF